jgi:hypothetical protein
MKAWLLMCETDGAVTTYSASEPTECPINAAHTVQSVMQLNDQEAIFMRDSNGDLWEMKIDTSGTWIPTKKA